MAVIHGAGTLAPIPDDLTIAQFMLDYQHPTRPAPPDHRPWFIEDESGRGVSFAEVKGRTHALANAFHSKWNLSEDDVVCIYSPNHVDYPIVIWAAFRLGAVITAANPAYTAEELVHCLTITKAKLLVVHPWNLSVALEAAKIAKIPADCVVLLEPLPTDEKAASAKLPTVPQLIVDGEKAQKTFTERTLKKGEAKTKLAFLSFSSGTTGLPKAVQIPHYSLIANVVQIASYAQTDPLPPRQRKIRPGDVGVAVLPFYHIYGIVVIMHFGTFYGLSVVVTPKFDFLAFLKSIQRHRINFLTVVPPMVVALCKHPAVKKFDLSSMHFIASGAAPLAAELTNQLAQLFPKVQIGQGYGMTETCTVIAFPQIEQHVCTPGSAGRLLPGVVVKVVRPDGSLAPRGETGEFVVRSPSNAVGYLDNEKATKETFRDGWVYTGDEVYINDENELFVVDRIKDLIKVKGFQVAPPELEGHILALQDVSDVCVVGKPDEYSGEVPYAFIVPSAAAQARITQDPAEGERIKAAVIKHVADNKVHFKRLAGGVEFIDMIPRNPSGKLMRRMLRDRLRTQPATKAKL